ncbi:unnamed protein product [Euphydryas editha]|uniref:C2H2-type domain-containing protein n=1 Tax=Euphydryas editha TaxID=104508 RepID=A0AAU9UM10_EUPED|nr:unnamed protein product [Euphydryas editha]
MWTEKGLTQVFYFLGERGKTENKNAIKLETSEKFVSEDSFKVTEKKRYQRSARAEARFVTKKNASSILECWTLCPFRWKRNRFKCAYCEDNFTECAELRNHVRLCSTQHSVKDIYSKFKEMSLINIDITEASCRICAMPFRGVNEMRYHVIDHGYDFDTSHPDGVLPFFLDKEAWKCVICQESFNNFLKLYEHMNIHYQYYICATCGKGYMTAPRLRKHSEVHITGTFPCDKCRRVFTMRAARDYHKSHAHAKSPRYECPQCNMRFGGYYERMNHLNEAHREKEVSYKCAHCELSFKTSGKRAIHVRSVHFPQQRNFACPFCKWLFKTGYELKRHMVKHTGPANADTQGVKVRRVRKLKENVCARQIRRRRRANNELPEESEKRIAKTMMRRNAMMLLECSTVWAFRWFQSAFYCSYCDAKFVDPLVLRDHVSSYHLDDIPTKRIFSKLTENNMIKVDVSNIHCRMCNCKLETIDFLKKHLINTHEKFLNQNYNDGILPFKLESDGFECQICCAHFTSFCKINEHMNTHFKNYICDACGKAFVSKSRFRTHVQSHEIGSFPCGICDEILETRVARMCHRSRIHKKGIRYTCPHCPEVFTSYYARAKHLVDGHNQQKREYECFTCGKSFETSCKRAAHTRDGGTREIKLKIEWKKTRRATEDKANAALILEGSNAVAFRWMRGKFMCASCPKICANVNEIRSHSQMHDKLSIFQKQEVRNSFPLRIDITNLKCSICDIRLENLVDLKDHLQIEHSKNFNTKYGDGVIPFILTTSEYRCVHCDMLFQGYMNLFSHMNEHYQSFVCYTCGKGYSAKHKLRAHQKCHETGRIACPKCDLVFANHVVKNRHVATAHGPKKRYRCPICDLTFKSCHSRLKHLDKMHGPIKTIKWKRGRRVYNDHRDNAAVIIEFSNACPFRWKRGAFACSHCPKTFGQFQDVFNHAQEHSDRLEAMRYARPYDNMKIEISNLKCVICQESMKGIEQLKEHLLNDHQKPIQKGFGLGVTPFLLQGKEMLCTHCDERFPFFSTLNSHMNQHYPNNICFHCGKSFSAVHRLKAHQLTHETNEKEHKCSKCDEVFKTRTGRRNHINTKHAPENRYKCPYCNSSFKRYSERLKHLKEIHNQSVEYPCHLCSAIFAMSDQRTKHIKNVHIKHKQFQCDYCPSKFVTAGQLKSHLVRHTGLREYQCIICKKSYARVRTLREHMRIHNNDRRFVCEYCNNAFIQKCSLKSHMRSHHPTVESTKSST